MEAQKEAVNNAEVNNATGLSSGARAQLRLSNQNQMHSDMTALRAQQQEIDAEIERSRSLLSQEYASAIRKAQQDNDLARAEALYKEAEKQEELLRQKQEQTEAEEKANALTAAQLLASAGDYSRLGKIYGLSDAEIAALVAADTAAKNETKAATQAQNGLAAAKILAEAGDYTLLGKYYGLTDEQIAQLAAKNQPGQALLGTLSGGVKKVGNWISDIFKNSNGQLGTAGDGGAYDKLHHSISAHKLIVEHRQGLTYEEKRALRQTAYNEQVAAINDAYTKGQISTKQRDSLLSLVAS